MPRPLPSEQEAMAILAARPPRPPPRPPRHAGRAFAPLLKELDARFGQGPDVLRSRWREIVGEALAGRSEPVKLVKARTGGSTLELRVAGPVAALVQHQAPEILARLNLYLGAEAVARLRIVQGPLTAPAARTLPRGNVRRMRAPLDAAAEKVLADSLAEAPEGPLRRALLRLGREVLRAGD
ncbi:MAG: DciA family protein [Caulobacterales bacterium]